MIRAIFPSLNIGLMGQRKAQFSENWKTHFLCFMVTKLSTDKRVHSINSGVIHLTIAPLCFPLGAAWKYALRGPFAQMSAQMKRGKRMENVKQDAENLKRGALCRPPNSPNFCAAAASTQKKKKAHSHPRAHFYLQQGGGLPVLRQLCKLLQTVA